MHTKFTLLWGIKLNPRTESEDLPEKKSSHILHLGVSWSPDATLESWQAFQIWFGIVIFEGDGPRDTCALIPLRRKEFLNKNRNMPILPFQWQVSWTVPGPPGSKRLKGSPSGLAGPKSRGQKQFYQAPGRPVRTLSLIHIWRCRRIERCRSRWSPYH